MSNIATTNINFSKAVESSVTATNADMTASETVQGTATTEGASVLEDETADEGKIRIPGFQVLGLKKICGTSDYTVTLLFENPKIGLKETVSLSMPKVKSPAKFRKKISSVFSTPYKPSKMIEDLQYAIYQELNSPDFTVGYALPQGFSFVGDELFYVIGDRVLPIPSFAKEYSVSVEDFSAENPKRVLFCFTEITDSNFVGSHLKYFAVRQRFGALLVLQIF